MAFSETEKRVLVAKGYKTNLGRIYHSEENGIWIATDKLTINRELGYLLTRTDYEKIRWFTTFSELSQHL